MRLGDEEEKQAETAKAIQMHMPGAAKGYDPWDDLY